MAQQNITIGTQDAKAGDTLYTAFTKTEANFTQLFADNLSSTITVNQANIATTIGATIDSTKSYLIDGVIDFTGTGLSIEVPSGGISIVGTTFDTSRLICSDINFTLFNSPVGGSGNVVMDSISIGITGTGSQVFNLKDATGFSALEWTAINFNNCNSLGIIDNYRQGLESGTGRFGGTPELTLKGVWVGGYFIDSSIVRSLSAGTYSLYAKGTGFSMASRFRTNQNIDLPTGVSFFDFSPAEFVNPSTLQVDSAIVSRNGVIDANDALIAPNVSASDLCSAWKGNQGMPNTFTGGALSLTTEVLTVISAVNTYTDILGTFTSADLQHFDVPSNGQLRNLGNNPREYNVISSVVLEGTANDVYAIKFVKWDDSASAFLDIGIQKRQVSSLIGSRDVAVYAMFFRVNLDRNDYVKMQVENQTSAGNCTLELDSFFTVSER